MATVVRVVFLSFIASFFAIGLYDTLVNYEKNGCEMTYMYQYPKYINVPLDKEVKKQFPYYKLYVYGEGAYARKLERKEYSGIPVLFIPGHSGSYRQVRSLGSVSLTMAESRNSLFHFNYFSIDFDEEFTGAFGSVVKKQTEFAQLCVKHILSLYSSAKSKPKSVILVGHSMGGMVARGIFTLPDFDPKTVTTVFTQATPHKAPVIQLDPDMASFYSNVNSYWLEHVNDTLKYTVLVSTGGGFRDFLVKQGLVSTHGLLPFERTLSTSTMSIPNAWVSTDHLCHVWCKQFVMLSVRAIFDMVDRTSKQIAINPTYRMGAALHHFVHNTGSKMTQFSFDKTIALSPDIKWELRKKATWRLSRDSMTTTRYSVVPLPIDSEYAAVAMTNIQTEHWIGVCTVKPKKKKVPTATLR